MRHDVSAFTFVIDPSQFASNRNDFVAWVPPDISSRQALFDTLARELKFPDYFGQNWDALDELLRDFWWVKQRRIVIVHLGLPTQLGEDNLRVYLEILMSDVKDWKPGDEHELVVVFPLSCRETIQGILQK
jgi:RNAse (barnase) inhibitor barstar